jgi:hypothetical protein
MIEVQPSLPPVRVVTTDNLLRVFHEHPVVGRTDDWVRLRQADSRFVCSECGMHEGFSGRRP